MNCNWAWDSVMCGSQMNVTPGNFERSRIAKLRKVGRKFHRITYAGRDWVVHRLRWWDRRESCDRVSRSGRPSHPHGAATHGSVPGQMNRHGRLDWPDDSAITVAVARHVIVWTITNRLVAVATPKYIASLGCIPHRNIQHLYGSFHARVAVCMPAQGGYTIINVCYTSN